MEMEIGKRGDGGEGEDERKKGGERERIVYTASIFSV